MSCYMINKEFTDIRQRRLPGLIFQFGSVQLYPFLYSFRSATSGLRRPSPLACTVGQAAAFTVKPALVASQWKHRARTVPVHPPINTEHDTRLVFQVFGKNRLESKHAYRLWWRVFNQLYRLGGSD